VGPNSVSGWGLYKFIFSESSRRRSSSYGLWRVVYRWGFVCAERLAYYVLFSSCFGLVDDLRYRGRYDAGYGADTFSLMTEESALYFGYIFYGLMNCT
jgi:hypothetical protein